MKHVNEPEAYMPDQPYDPTDHARTTRPRMGEAMKDKRSLGGYAALGLAVVAIAMCLGTAGHGLTGWAVGAGIVAVVLATIGSVWVYAERRHMGRVAQEHAIDEPSPGLTRARRRN
jgi:hypothetical protein